MVSIDIISGFLGSGKTTFIKKLLPACLHTGEKVVIIENEFGQIGIDGPLLRRDGFDVIEINQGCVCCSLKGEFKAALRDILLEYKPDRILFEPSGIFVLSEITDVLADVTIAGLCRLGTVVSIIDAVNYINQNEKYTCFFEAQIAKADVLVLSKSQQVSFQDTETILAALRNINSDARLISKDWAELSPNEMYSMIQKPVAHKAADGFNEKTSIRHSRFESMGIRTASQFSVSELENICTELRSGQYGEVVRGKGLIAGPIGMLTFDYVNGRYTVDVVPETDEGLICLIGQNLNRKKLKKLFCMKS